MGDGIVEVSQTPTLLEDAVGVSAAACGGGASGYVVDGKLSTFGGNKYQTLGRVPSDDALKGTGAAPGVCGPFSLDGREQRVTSVAFGGLHAGAITEGGHLWTWGWGGSFWYGAGGLGHGDRDACPQPKLVQKFVEQGESVKQVALAHQHSLVLTDEGRVYTTGKGEFGRLGNGDNGDELEFEELLYFQQSNDSVLAPEDQTLIVKVACGNNFSAALSSSGELWLWGRNDHGQLGLGEEAMGDMYSAERYPRLVRSLPLEGHRVVDFACGENHVVILTAAGSIYEWGNRTWLEPHPLTLPARYQEGLQDIRMVAAGDKYSFALNGAGQVYVWGAKNSGCLALGEGILKNVVEPTPVPVEFFGNQKVVDIVAGKHRCLAITEEDTYITGITATKDN